MKTPDPKAKAKPMNLRSRNWWFTNRVLLGMVLFFATVAMWEFHWKPQYKPFYEQGIAYYHGGNYRDALHQFERAYQIDPNAVDVIIMMGWTNLKLKRWEEARFYFDRAIKIDPRLEEAQMGASFVALETGRGKLDPKLLAKLLGKRKGDPNVMILTAGALQQEGEFFQAADIYRDLSDDKNYGAAAKLALATIYGTDGFEGDKTADALPEVSRAGQLQMRYRAANGSFLRQGASGWEQFYLNGVDLGPEAPGYYPLSPPTKGAMYLNWVRMAAQMNADALRVYTLLPPAFYRAFRHYRSDGGSMGLIQQVWVSEPPRHDLYTPKYVEATKAEIRNIVDALHGRGEVPPSADQSSGIYEQDVSAGVVGILFGGELDPATISQTNILNAGNRQYDGKYVSIADADASEVWYAQMLDYLVEYETTTYNWQHPVAISNAPQSDPKRGSVTEEKLRATPQFQAGLFAAYSAFPYYPESLTRDPEYLRARDSDGPNPVLGYLRALRAKITLPLVVSEYGISTAVGIRRLQENGWNQGGHTEQSQADVMAKLTRTIHDAGCAGGIVFELADEWYRQGWMKEGFETPADRAPLWINELDPNKSYGMLGYRTRGWRLFTGDPSVWEKETKLYDAVKSARVHDEYDGERQIQSVQAAEDEGFLYLRIVVACLDCVGGKHDGKMHLDKAAYAVAINTLPNRAGVQSLPFGGVALTPGANFLLYLGDPANSKLLVAENYNPYLVAPRVDYPNEIQMIYRAGFAAGLSKTGRFIEFPAGPGASPSALPYGDGNPASKDYDSLAEWNADIRHNAILARLPWGKLLVTDPSSLHAFFGYSTNTGVRAAVSSGIQISVFGLATNGATELGQMAVSTAAPEMSGTRAGTPNALSWQVWNEVKPDSYIKKAYYAMQKEFAADNAGKPSANSRASIDARAGVR